MELLFGSVLMILAFIGVAWVIISWAWVHPTSTLGKFVEENLPWGAPEWAKERAEEKKRQSESAMEEAIRTARPEEILSQKGERVLETENGILDIHAEAIFEELKAYDKAMKDWRHTSPEGEVLREFIGRLLPGNRFLFQQPEHEGGELIWILYERKRIPQGFAERIKNIALKFVDAEQGAGVNFTEIGSDWTCRDIIHAHVLVTNERRSGFFVGRKQTRARVAMLLASKVDDETSFFCFCNLRSGDGSDTLWVGSKFNPETVQG